MNNALVKSLILALAIAIAVGGVLFFIQTVVSPPEDIKVEDTHTTNIKNYSDSYNPDSLGLIEAEKVFDAIVDRADIYKEDSFIEQKSYDEVISSSAEKFSDSFVQWSMSKFAQSSWNSNDHAVMRRIIKKLRNIKIDQESKKALGSHSLASLTKIEDILNEYGRAWNATKQTKFTPWNYDDARSKRTNAETFARKKYLSNCKKLVKALHSVGESLEKSCYYQLTQRVNQLHYHDSFSSKEAYDNESSLVYDLIQNFEETTAFGVSTAAHAKVLQDLQDSYDRDAEYYEWSE